MNLTSPSQVKAWCIAHDFHPNKVLGQNFLIDRNALDAIVDAGLAGVDLGAGARVLEIGPGLGVLTEEMLRRGCSVVAVEKDPVLAARLAESLGNPPGLTVIAGDALEVIAHPERFPGSADAARPFSCMVSNLPYQAGTRILLDLVQLRQLPAMTILVQTEVAERLAAREGSKTR
ncbi:MAG: 16S rRNA (adenine(1518)-N(6)/adenine(1519)-N(6))-dimethyltransferase, partial [Kiritimatiellae bacterium]|nr:16S rRNA (adenine(1518)-N(6)/adenine(1519)-N(6))-dimethyltransferase [Kiritimatiellia bacterium]